MKYNGWVGLLFVGVALLCLWGIKCRVSTYDREQLTGKVIELRENKESGIPYRYAIHMYYVVCEVDGYSNVFEVRVDPEVYANIEVGDIITFELVLKDDFIIDVKYIY